MHVEAGAVVHSTFVIERSFTVSPERVFAAFADPAKKQVWFAAPHGLEVDEFTMDFQVGGVDVARFRMGANTPFPGTPLENRSTYLDIVENRRIVNAYTMTLGGGRISASLSTFEFLPTATGTDLVFTEQSAFLEGADGPVMRQDGWSKMLDALAKELAG